MKIRPGSPHPLGAHWDGAGVNFCLFSENATRVELCLFDAPDSTRESARIPMPEQTDMVWHCYIRDVRPGQLYRYRVHGPYDPKSGLRFNPSKIVLDPYAKGIGRSMHWDDSLLGYASGKPDSADDRDDAPLLLYTDGVPEARNAQENEFRLPRLLEWARCHSAMSPADLLEALEKELTAFQSGAPTTDDLSIMAIQRTD